MGAVVHEPDEGEGGEELSHPSEDLRDAELGEVTPAEQRTEPLESAGFHLTPRVVDPR